MIDRRPALIARVADADDVARAIAFAPSTRLPLAVRGGGHNGAGFGTCDDGVVIDLSLHEGHRGRPEARTVRVGGGCTWGEVDRATREHGLATPSGIISTTGVGGLTLGGGLGHLTRAFGLAIDNLLAADVVLADGGCVHGERRREPGPVLGAPRRRRELRRGHVVPVPRCTRSAPSSAARCSGRSSAAEGAALAYREFMAAAPRDAQRLVRVRHRASRPAVPRGDPSARRSAAWSGATWATRRGAGRHGAAAGRRCPSRCSTASAAMPHAGAAGRVRRRCIRGASSGTGARTSSRTSRTRRRGCTPSTAHACRR